MTDKETGSPSAGPLSAKPVPEMTQAEVERFSKFVDYGPDCWPWKGTLKKGTYGQFKLRGKFYKAHRVSWAIAHGGVPRGLTLDHLCNHGACVRPSHLRVATMKENLLASPAATAAQFGHPLRGRY